MEGVKEEMTYFSDFHFPCVTVGKAVFCRGDKVRENGPDFIDSILRFPKPQKDLSWVTRHVY